MNPAFESKHSIRNILGVDGDIEAPPTPPDSVDSRSPHSSPPPIQRPNYTFKDLVKMAIRNCPQNALPLCAIVDWISLNFPYYRKEDSGWQCQVRHTLSTLKCFKKLVRPIGQPGRGNFWAVVPDDHQPVVPIAVPHADLYTEVLRNGIACNHPQAEGAVYFPTPEEARAYVAAVAQQQHEWFLHQQQP
ncbi:forkhead box protein G1-like [Ceratitis capitata]|uniref:forkhead box protein G1-like n=1 Tax=Ceratitis capitata TaxID=7213 RepID=UPI000C6C75F0|nr:forkhead box protein G1-like [Ceratitis capitata]